MKKGSLYIVGTGIKAIKHITLEAKNFISDADKVFYLTTNKVIEEWIKELNTSAESLYVFYQENKPRLQSYQEMIDKMLENVRSGLKVCAVFYGHPGVFVYPSHEAIKLARQEGYQAVMMPGVSAEDCLFADLGIDPGKYGCQSFEATDFLIYRRKFDPRISLVLWQAGLVGCLTYEFSYKAAVGLPVLVEKLLEEYPSSHEVVIYQASTYSLCAPIIKRLPLDALQEEKIGAGATLYIPPLDQIAPDREMIKRLSIDTSLLSRRPMNF